MARNDLLTRIELDSIHCHDEGDGPGSAEPYLWTMFFKVDGETVAVSPSLTLTGEATTRSTPGSHGNLPNSDVDAGEDIPVPAAIGQWQTVLQPIPVPDSLSALLDDVGGLMGVVVVLMEEDNVTDSGAEAGHRAFDRAVRDAINRIVATRSLSNQDVSDEDLASFQGQVSDAVTDAVTSQQTVFENIWSWLNADDTIGFKAFTLKHDDLADRGTIQFSHRWRNEGDWELSGSVTAVRTCPAEALQDIFDGDSRAELDRLRGFRDGPFREHPGLVPWFRALERNMPALILVLAREPQLRRETAQLWRIVTSAAADLDAPLERASVEQAARLALELARRTQSRRLRVDAARAADVLPGVRGRTAREGVASLSRLQLARNPGLNGWVQPLRPEDDR